MSYPVIYAENATDFFNLGLGTLPDATKVEVAEERNGEFTLVMTYLVDGLRANEIKKNRIIKVDAGHVLKGQRFVIKKINKQLVDRKIQYQVYAEHVSYITNDLQLKPKVSVSGSGDAAIKAWRSNIIDVNPLVVDSDIETNTSTSWTIDKVQSARQALGGVAGSLLDLWGGEYRFDNYHISLKKQRGTVSNTLLSYGRNITDFDQEENITDTYTSVYPYATYTETTENSSDSESKLLTLPELTIDSKYVGNYPNRKILPVDLTAKFAAGEKPTEAKLREFAKSYVTANDIGVPKVSIKLSFVDLSQSSNYEALQLLEALDLCDTVPVRFTKLGVDTKTKVSRVVWDVLADHYTSMELGDTRYTIGDMINNAVDTANEANQNSQEAQNSANHAVISADGHTMIFYGPGTPSAKNIGDLWYKPDGEYEILYRWDGKVWSFVMSTRDTAEAKDAADKASKEAEEAKNQANKAVDGANDAVAKAGFATDMATQAKSDAAAAGQQAKDALTSAGTAAADAVTAKNDAATALTDAKKALTDSGSAMVDSAQARKDSAAAAADAVIAKNDAATALTDAKKALTDSGSAMVDSAQARKDSATAIKDAADSLTSAKDAINKVGNLTTSVTSQFTTVNNELKSKVNQTDYDKLKGTVTSQQTEINQNASGINLKADKPYADTINNSVVKNTSSIGLLNNQIALTVSKAELNNTLSSYATQTWTQSQIKLTSDQINLSVSNVDSKINNLTTGGTNLIPNSGDFQKTDHWWWTDTLEVVTHNFYRNGKRNMLKLSTASTTGEATLSSDWFDVTAGSKYVLQFHAFAPATVKSMDVRLMYRKYGSSNVNHGWDGIIAVALAVPLSASKDSVYYYSVTPPAGADEMYLRVDNNGSTDGASHGIYFGEFKMAKETKPSPWAPAPEDLVTNIKYAELTVKVDGITATVANKADKTQITQLANQINLKADTTALNTLKGTVDKQGSEITLNTNSIKLKADQSSVDTLKGTVDKQGSAIDVNTKAIALKASQSTVDTLTGRVSTAEGKITVQADQIAQTVSKTELTTKLNGYATQTWTQSQIKSTADSINLSVTKVDSKVDNLNTSDRNLLIKSGTFETGLASDVTVSNNTYGGNRILMIPKSPADNTTHDPYVPIPSVDMVGTEYVLSFYLKADVNGDKFAVNLFSPNTVTYAINSQGIVTNTPTGGDGYSWFTATNTWVRYWVKYTQTSTNAKKKLIIGRTGTATIGKDNKGGFQLASPMLSEGNMTNKPWAAAPEDFATDIEFSELQVTVNSIQGTVQNKADQSQITQLSNQISLKADTTALNELKGTVDKQGSEITLNTNSIKLKADQSSVDTLKGTVDKQGSAIDVNTKAIALKASQSTVDTLTGRVSTAEGKITVQADQIAQTVSKTELTNILGDYATQTWTQSQIKSTADQINLSVVSLKTEVENNGAENLIQNSSFKLGKAGWSGWEGPYIHNPVVETYHSKPYTAVYFGQNKQPYADLIHDGKIPLTPSTSYVFQIKTRSLIKNHAVTYIQECSSDGKVINDHAFIINVNSPDYITNVQKFTTSAAAEYAVLRIRAQPGDQFMASELMLTEGTLAPKNWYPSSVDNATTADFASLEITIKGIQSTVTTKADQSQVTQLAGQITSVVGDVSANSSQITQMKADINLRVQKSDVVNQINISPEGILIDGQKVHITGLTRIDNAVIKDAMIADIKADKITAGTLNAANVNVINLNANNITTGTLKGANLSMNLNTGEILFQKGSIRSTNGNLNINIDDGSMSLTNSQGEGAYFIDGKIAMTKNDIWTNGAIHYGQLTFGNNIFGNALGSVSGVRLEGAGGVIVGNKEFNPLTLFGPGKTTPSGGGIAANNKFATVASNGWASIEGGTLYAVPFSTNNPSIVAGVSGKYSAPGAWMPTSDKGPASFVKGKLVGLYAEDGGFSMDHGTTADLAAAVDGRSGYILSAATYARTYASGAQMTITANGVFGRISSASKYKLAIGEISTLNDEAHQFLSVKPKQWFDKSESEALADTMTTGNTDYIDDAKALPHTGFIAEDLYTAGLDNYVIRGNDGSIESIQYDRLPVLHHELIRELFNRLDAAEMEIYKLKQEVINNAS